jgi:hypothetical protein
MTTDLIKVQPRPDHFHKDNQAVCERCMSKIASSGNSVFDLVQEQSYLLCRIMEVCLATLRQALAQSYSKAQTEWKRVDLAECLYLTYQGIRIALEPLAILIFALSVVLVGIFAPRGPKTPEELRNERRLEKDKLFNEYKDRNFNAHKLHIDADRTPDPDKRKKYRERAREEDNLSKEALHKYSRT